MAANDSSNFTTSSPQVSCGFLCADLKRSFKKFMSSKEMVQNLLPDPMNVASMLVTLSGEEWAQEFMKSLSKYVSLWSSLKRRKFKGKEAAEEAGEPESTLFNSRL
jgi:hypothetical protein